MTGSINNFLFGDSLAFPRSPFWLFVQIACAALLFVVGGSAMASDLAELLIEKAGTDPRVLAARSIHQSKLTEAEGAWSAYLPVLRGTGGTGNVRNQDPLQRQGEKRTYGLEIEQPIPLFGRESARVELARVAVRVEVFELKRVEQEVLAEMIGATLTTQAARETLALRDQLAALHAEQFRAAQEAVAGGGMKATEARLIQSRAARAEALRAKARIDLVAAQARLAFLLPGVADASLNGLDLPSWWIGAQLSQSAVEALALQKAPTLLKAQAQAELAGAELAVAKSDMWPRLSLTVSAQRGTFGAATADSDSLFLGFNMPLYEGGASVNRVDSAAHRYAAAQEHATHERRMVQQRVAEAWARWQAADAMVQAWHESERQDEESIRLTEEQLLGGANTVIGLAAAQQTALETRIEGAEYRHQRGLAWMSLMQEAGALAPSVTPTEKKE